jgi:hypothetical protein
MSTGAAIAIAGGGTLVVAAAIVVMMVWLGRSNKAREQAIMGRLKDELPRRGWTYEERNDSYASVYNADRKYMQESLLKLPTRQNPMAPFEPFHLPPKAIAARRIITGTHRGRPFLAADFTVNYAGEQNTERVIWVRTPAPGPAFTLSRERRLQTRVRRAMGQIGMETGNPDFDDQFEISEEDERFARLVLNPALIQFILIDPDRFQSLELLGDHIDLSDQVGDYRDPARLIPALDLRCDLLDRIPASAWA